MAGVKGNSGKAARSGKDILVAIAVAAVLVVGLKTFSSGAWHGKAIIEDQQSHSRYQQPAEIKSKIKSTKAAAVPSVEDADAKGIEDHNLIQYVFGNLDGEDGHDGEVVVRLHPDWAPIGVKRIKELTADSFWDDCRAFRVLPNFVVQLGINGDPKKQKKWKVPIADDPVKATNDRGTVTFAMAGEGTRTTQIFFNKVDNSRLDKEKFAPFGEVIR